MPPAHAGAVFERRLTAGIAGVLVFIVIAFGQYTEHVLGGVYYVLTGAAVLTLSWTGSWNRPRLRVEEKRLIFAVLFYTGIQLFAWLHGQTSLETGEQLGGALRMLMLVPIYLALRRVPGLDSYALPGLLVGGAGACLYAMWVLATGADDGHGARVTGTTSPLWFGGMTLAFALMMLGLFTRPAARPPLRLLILLALTLALAASAASGSRGAWLALPVVLLMYPLTLGRNHSFRWRWGLVALVGLMASLLLVAPGMPLGSRLLDAARAVGSLFGGGETAGTVGLRIEMWRVAIEAWLQNPLLGSGLGGYERAIDAAVAEGRLGAHFDRYTHAHNSFLQALTEAGLPGLLAVGLLFGIPAMQFWRWLHRPHLPLATVAWCGLAGLSVILIMGLTEAVFARNIGVGSYGLLLALTYAMAYQRRAACLAADTGRGGRTLSVTIIACDEADRIGACLASVHGWADDIVVFDSGSTDGTPDLCRRYGVRLFETDWPGYGVQKQRALDAATGDWVLSLDADERVTPELRSEIDRVVCLDDPAVAGYRVRWHLEAFGGHMDFGRWTRSPLRLFRRERARFETKPVHEKVVIPAGGGRTERLESILRHAIYRDHQHARDKYRHYAELQTRVRHAGGRRTLRVEAPLRAAINFLDNLLIRLGVLDGRHGWFMAREQARYTWLKYHLQWRHDRRPA